MSNTQTLSSQPLPRGVIDISIDKSERSIYLEFSSSKRVRQFIGLFTKGKPFSLWLLLAVDCDSKPLKSFVCYVGTSFPNLFRSSPVNKSSKGFAVVKY